MSGRQCFAEIVLGSIVMASFNVVEPVIRHCCAIPRTVVLNRSIVPHIFFHLQVRRDATYVYEEFLSTFGTDVKVYTVGQIFAHAEARKSPTLDGKVQRTANGKVGIT